MNITQQIIMVVAGVVATMLTRFIPFIAFRPNRPTSKYIMYLGKVLPASVFAMLVVYCLRSSVSIDRTIASWHIVLSPDAWPQFVAVAFTILVHVWRKNIMLSIAAGTICYMILIRLN